MKSHGKVRGILKRSSNKPKKVTFCEEEQIIIEFEKIYKGLKQICFQQPKELMEARANSNLVNALNLLVQSM